MYHPMEGHTVQRYDGELIHLHISMLEMGGLVFEQVRMSLEASNTENHALAHQVMEREHQVDELELKLDEEVFSIIVRRGPMARDLRILMAFSKSIADMERIGDEAARIAYLTKSMFEDNHGSIPGNYLMHDIRTMGILAVNLLENALEIFDTLNIEKAEVFFIKHAQLDIEFRSSLRRLATFVLEDARNVGHTVNITQVVKSLERIGDHARNIVEYAVYLIKGEDIRHQLNDPGNQDDVANTDMDDNPANG